MIVVLKPLAYKANGAARGEIPQKGCLCIQLRTILFCICSAVGGGWMDFPDEQICILGGKSASVVVGT